MSTVLDRDRPGRLGQDYFAYFANPYNVTRTIALVIARDHPGAPLRRRSNGGATCGRGSSGPFSYALVRAWGTVVQTDLQVAGRDRGPLRRAARRLHDLPRLRRGRAPLGSRAGRHARRRCAGWTARSGASPRRPSDAPRPYRFVVLSDHGQSQGDDLPRPLRHHARGPRQPRPATPTSVRGRGRQRHDEALGYLAPSLTEASEGDSRRDRARPGGDHAAGTTPTARSAWRDGEPSRSEMRRGSCRSCR